MVMVVSKRGFSWLAPLVCAVSLGAAGLGCASPTPLAPALRGSVGLPHRGVLTDGVELPRKGDGYVLLRSKGARWGHPRLVAAIQRAAAEVERLRPGAPPLTVGDLSAERGGQIRGHRSHRTGRDVDLLFHALTPEGKPIRSPGFVRYGRDGLAEVEEGGKTVFYRLDVERTWLLVRALVESPEAAVQWLFVARWLEALITEYARARGEDPEIVWHAESVLLQPGDSAAHDDHLHLRIACTPEDAVAGCEGGGPQWSWLSPFPVLAPPPDEELGLAMLEDLFPFPNLGSEETALPSASPMTPAPPASPGAGGSAASTRSGAAP
ncbi:penicillin-insensitive murein endopeptidase [Chondromyces crocatus]|uniref:Murein endopeptidase n=1 Tax=Chondromyces crocatus TaxID=52 RepID=A0A0K1E830_CHOCO|nr:penicillin-insensitive murein endopeptidase [Chondromyces crocatus]AKT37014.1 murein endopeptidase [Chondromyces crocatus]